MLNHLDQLDAAVHVHCHASLAARGARVVLLRGC